MAVSAVSTGELSVQEVAGNKKVMLNEYDTEVEAVQPGSSAVDIHTAELAAEPAAAEPAVGLAGVAGARLYKAASNVAVSIDGSSSSGGISSHDSFRSPPDFIGLRRLSLEDNSQVSIQHGEDGQKQTFRITKENDHFYSFVSVRHDKTPVNSFRVMLGERLPLVLLTFSLIFAVYFTYLPLNLWGAIPTFIYMGQLTSRIIIYTYAGIILPNMFTVVGLICMLYWLFKYPDPYQECPEMERVPMVTVQLPVYNEQTVVIRLLDSVCSMDWPADRLEVQIVSNSTDNTGEIIEEVANKWRARGITVTHLHRNDKLGFKAGNLNLGLRFAMGEFIAILDASNIPEPDWLQKSIPYFKHEKTGVVQCRWDSVNRDKNYLTKAQGMLYDEAYTIQQTSRYRRGTFLIFNGQSGIWRKKALEDVTGFPITTITEDMHISYMAQRKGWKILFRHDTTVKGELPETVRAWLSQQYRWAKGHAQVAPIVFGQIMKSPLSLGLKMLALVDLLKDFSFVLLFMLLMMLPLVVESYRVVEPYWYETLAFTVLLTTLMVATVMAHVISFVACGESRIRLLYMFPLMLMVQSGMVVNQAAAIMEGTISNEVTFVVRKKKGSGSMGGVSGLKVVIGLLNIFVAAYYNVGLVVQFDYLQGYLIPVYVIVALGNTIIGVQFFREIADLSFGFQKTVEDDDGMKEIVVDDVISKAVITPARSVVQFHHAGPSNFTFQSGAMTPGSHYVSNTVQPNIHRSQSVNSLNNMGNVYQQQPRVLPQPLILQQTTPANARLPTMPYHIQSTPSNAAFQSGIVQRTQMHSMQPVMEHRPMNSMTTPQHVMQTYSVPGPVAYQSQPSSALTTPRNVNQWGIQPTPQHKQFAKSDPLLSWSAQGVPDDSNRILSEMLEFFRWLVPVASFHKNRLASVENLMQQEAAEMGVPGAEQVYESVLMRDRLAIEKINDDVNQLVAQIRCSVNVQSAQYQEFLRNLDNEMIQVLELDALLPTADSI